MKRYKMSYDVHVICGVCKSEMRLNAFGQTELREMVERFDKLHGHCRGRAPISSLSDAEVVEIANRMISMPIKGAGSG